MRKAKHPLGRRAWIRGLLQLDRRRAPDRRYCDRWPFVPARLFAKGEILAWFSSQTLIKDVPNWAIALAGGADVRCRRSPGLGNGETKAK